jgi:hypothetical protein
LFKPCSVQPEQDKQQDGKTPKRGASVAEKRQRNANYGHNAKYHPYVDGEVEEENAGYTISIDTAEYVSLPFGNAEQPHEEQPVHT